MLSTLPGQRCYCLLAACLLLLSFATRAQDDGLQAALQSALQQHPSVLGKQAQVLAREHAADAARSQRYPSLSLQAAQYGGNQRDASGQDVSTPVTLQLRQPLWAFGRIDSSIAHADAQTGVEQADLLRVQRQLLEQTALAYATVLGSRQRLQVVQDNLQAHEQLHEQIQRRSQGQLASDADVRLAATRLVQARSRVDRYLGELDVAQTELLALTRQALPAIQPLDEAWLRPAPADLLPMALAQSAEIQVLQQALLQARAGVEQARTSARPTLYLQAEKDYNQSAYRDDNRVSLVFEASLTGMGLASRGNTRAAQAQQQAAEQDLQHRQIEVERQVRRLLRNRQLQDDLVALQQAALQELQAVLDSYKRQYVAGTKSWLDVLNIQRELSEQQLVLVQARNDWEILSLQLAALTGQLDALVTLTPQEF